MYIVITGYEVSDNVITNGGRYFPVAIIHIITFLKADKDTFKLWPPAERI